MPDGRKVQDLFVIAYFCIGPPVKEYSSYTGGLVLFLRGSGLDMFISACAYASQLPRGV